MSVNRFEKLLNHLSPQRSDFEPATETHIRQSSVSYLAYGFLWGGEACCPTLECHICRGNLSNGAVDQSKLKRSVFMCVKLYCRVWTAETAIGALLPANVPAWKSAAFTLIYYYLKSKSPAWRYSLQMCHVQVLRCVLFTRCDHEKVTGRST